MAAKGATTMKSFNNIAGKTYLTAAAVKERYKISEMTLWRWLRDEELKFPKPMIINRRKFFNEADLVAWDSLKMEEKPPAPHVPPQMVEQKQGDLYLRMMKEARQAGNPAIKFVSESNADFDETMKMCRELLRKLRSMNQTRELNLAKERVEEALFWASKHFKRGE